MDSIKHSLNEIKAGFHIQWTKQLFKDFDGLCYQYKFKMPKPNIVITELNGTLGQWDELTDTIFISEKLILNHHWEHVIGVFKHEIVHKVVSQILKKQDLHGKYFKETAKKIGLSSFYAGATLDLSKDFPDIHKVEKQKDSHDIIRKIEKLMSLAESSNEHEAMQALKTVADIYQKYNLSKISETEKSEFFTHTINFKKKKIPSHMFILTHILQEHFFVTNIFSHTYDAFLHEEHKTLVLMGRPHNVLMADYVYATLSRTIEHLWICYKKQKNLTAKYKNSYLKGLLTGFQKKLEKTKKIYEEEAKSTERGLILLENKELDDYVKTQFPRTKSLGHGGCIYTEHFEKGAKDGASISLHTPITTRSNGRKFLIR